MPNISLLINRLSNQKQVFFRLECTEHAHTHTNVKFDEKISIIQATAPFFSIKFLRQNMVRMDKIFVDFCC